MADDGNIEHSDALTPFYRAVDATSLGRSIAGARKEAALTQHDLALKLGVTRGTIVRLEAGGAVSMVVAMQAIRAVGRDVALVPRFSKLQVRP
ncbi:helix-turn-helix transcriptional regulator [Arthrobacter sp. ISL-95]|uniref:helix-turn-helix transcriptional regulator n=1 Tax=Arthrobacter sp. ISL-95 TaxID=2819116 RepID=UPI001BECE4F7|nr:helix-turn-helix domain-containing protein [Arthrobacter sp. ISL-95]MBT2584721.1 helix-turn-helix domain-containing protein [Arthrobacter sp. ISL-95]